MSEAVFRLKGIEKAYGDRQVLHVPELEIRRGEILGVVGPSGAGKSVLLLLLNLLEPPTAGAIEFLGRSADGGPESWPLHLRRQVTQVFQKPFLLNTSVRGNVEYGLRIRGESDAGTRVAEALERVGMTAFADKLAHTLSGGEAQRVALARALVIDPLVLLLDEPTANLDRHNVGIIEDVVTELNRARGTTVVLVTHNLFQAKRMADRVLFLLDGEVVEVAENSYFFDTPADPRTAAFIRGDMVY